MDRKGFGKGLAAVRDVVVALAVVLGAALVAALILVVDEGRSYRSIVLMLPVGTLLLCAAVAGVLALHYRSLPVVREKKEVKARSAALEKEIRPIQAKLDKAGAVRASINEEKHRAQKRIQAAYEEERQQRERQRATLGQRESAELAAALQRVQGQYMLAGLQAATVAKANLTGIGPKLKGELQAFGIRTAADVTAEEVARIPGFGPTRVAQVVAWREQAEWTLNARKPTRLSRDAEEGIRAKYRAQRAELEAQDARAEGVLRFELGRVEQDAAQRHAANDATEAQPREELKRLEPRRRQLDLELAAYEGITPWEYLASSVGGRRGGGGVRRSALNGLVVLMAVSLLFQGAAAVSTLGAMAVENRPTARPTEVVAEAATQVEGPATERADLGAGNLAATEVAPISDTPLPTETAAPTATWTPEPRATPTLRPVPTPTPWLGSPGADVVIAYNPGSGRLAAYGNPQMFLGTPDALWEPCCTGMAQLGAQGSVLLAFTDNVVVDGPGADLQVAGEPARDDFVLIELSADGAQWFAFSKQSEAPAPLDLGELGLEHAVYVRLTDLQPGTRTGAELDAVVALNSAPPLGPLPELTDGFARKAVALYEGPDTRMKTVATVAAGSAVTVVGPGNLGNWVKVMTTSGISGWCRSSELVLNVSVHSFAVVKAPPTPTRVVTRTPTPTPWEVRIAPTVRVCCKICTTGKACGNSCIAKWKTCHQPPGCACDG